ncbi:hypothetical protein F511_08136 [Dorcoceras hygrometricum]|uniref:Uncharacterized protein n=1 Tax=Dorcoceras hygrometricum TaxID=472368 RepID=A0A2Z7B516_9LAMI|nr:hypothetical protein F511_08136 [Dorcoceras hygrometricum]
MQERNNICFQECSKKQSLLAFICNTNTASYLARINGQTRSIPVKTLKTLIGFLTESSAGENLRSLKDMQSISDLATKEEQMLQMRQHQLKWTRPSSSNLLERTDVQSGEVLLRFYSSVKSTCWVMPLILIDGSWTVIQGTDRWRSGCRLTLFCKRKQLPQRPAVDEFVPMCFFIEPVQDLDSRPPYSGVVRRFWAEFCVDIVQFYLFGHLQPVGNYNLCRDIVAVGPVVELEAVPTLFLGVFRQGLDANLNPSNPSSSTISPLHFTADDIPQTPPTDDIPLDEATTADIPQIVLPSTDYTKSFLQLGAIVDQISLEQVQTRFHLDDLKAALSGKITDLERVVFLCFYSSGESVMTKRGKWRVVEVQNLLKIEADLEMEEEVEVEAVNLQRKEVVDRTDRKW